MRVRFCDFCGRGVQDTGGTNWDGWHTLSGTYGTGLLTPDVCPKCTKKLGPVKEIKLNETN